MPNRYNTLLDNQVYVSSHIPLPLELIAQQGATKQQKSDTTKKKLADSVLENIKSISEHDPYRNQYVQGFNEQAQALVGDPNIDFGSTEGKAKVYNLIKEHANNPNLQVLARSIDNKKQTLEDWSAVQKAGKGAYWNDPILRDQKLMSLGINPYMGEDGTPKEYDRKIAYSVEDHNKPVYDLFDKMKDDADVNAWANFTGDKTAISTGKKGWEGISADKVKLIADQNTETFKTTQGGQDFLRKFQFDYAEQLANLSPKERYEAENAAVTNHLYNIGNAYIHGKKIEDAGLSATSLLGKKYDEQEANKTTSRQSEAIKNDQIVDPTKDIEFDSTGSIKLHKKGNYVKQPGKDEFGVYDPNRVVWKADTSDDIDKAKQQTEIVVGIQRDHPELKGLTPKATVEAYRKAIKSVSSESIPLQSITNQAASKGIGTAIARNKQGREFYIQDGSGTVGNGDWKSVIEELGISEKEFNEQLEKGIGGYTQAGKIPGAYYVEIPVNDTETRRVLIAPDAEMQTIFRTSQALDSARKSMTRTTVKPFGENYPYQIDVIPNIKSNGDVTWNYIETSTDDRGNIVKKNVDIDDIREEERIALEQSNYIGSNVGSMKPNTVQ